MEARLASGLKKRLSHALEIRPATSLKPWIATGVAGLTGALATHAKMEKERAREILYKVLKTKESHARAKQLRQLKAAMTITCASTLPVVGVIGIPGATARARAWEEEKCVDAP